MLGAGRADRRRRRECRLQRRTVRVATTSLPRPARTGPPRPIGLRGHQPSGRPRRAADRRTDRYDTVAPSSSSGSASPTCSVWNRNPPRVFVKWTQACVRDVPQVGRDRADHVRVERGRCIRTRHRRPATAARAPSDRMPAPSHVPTPGAPTPAALRSGHRVDASIRTGRLPSGRTDRGDGDVARPRRPLPDAVRATANACLPPSATVEFADRDAF